MPEPAEATSAIAAIDSHAHVFRRGLPLAPVHRHAPDYDALLADYLALLDAHAVSHGVLVQPSFLGTDNSFLLDALRACPQRLRGVVIIEPTLDDDALADLDRQGVRGIRLNLVGLPIPDFARAEWQRLFDRVRTLDWHVELHRESRDLPQAGRPIVDAGCKLVVDHFGRPGAALANDEGFAWLLASAATERVWVKLAAAYRSWPDQRGSAARAAAQALLEAFGAGRLLWGSDWPHTQHQTVADFGSTREVLADWVEDEHARRRILVDTPAALFRFA
ncbi:MULTISPECIES: amidohydrolase family protein [unclassified Variovorax]|uniref:amidohydrolase family protein n=1 Tax=unclassified Variovorax TaxID=663243 RepID=UPI00076BC61A|nr:MULTISPECIES: amidohydrolase family protein [unclassified Variovorax]KWT71354.1 putative 2-pyrone-4,6-dicarboxylic acid hydrolase [Variovorax sp. WDL1]PNG59644.1 4-sulfomuconolactone hydrolase [Variovorax sp. B4]PNG60565.1 4-sulfomuconolactone hydrolase [Variovorax sp. B2]VTV13547.1 putative metal-dependent hydrolase of the TIM-barrel fold protein [Variovorax sp. WDL1]